MDTKGKEKWDDGGGQKGMSGPFNPKKVKQQES